MKIQATTAGIYVDDRCAAMRHPQQLDPQQWADDANRIAASLSLCQDIPLDELIRAVGSLDYRVRLEKTK